MKFFKYRDFILKKLQKKQKFHNSYFNECAYMFLKKSGFKNLK